MRNSEKGGGLSETAHLGIFLQNGCWEWGKQFRERRHRTERDVNTVTDKGIMAQRNQILAPEKTSKKTQSSKVSVSSPSSPRKQPRLPNTRVAISPSFCTCEFKFNEPCFSQSYEIIAKTLPERSKFCIIALLLSQVLLKKKNQRREIQGLISVPHFSPKKRRQKQITFSWAKHPPASPADDKSLFNLN